MSENAIAENVWKYVGPPGVGKTRTLEGSCRKNASVYGNSAVVCCSLTRAAAAVLAGRDLGIPEKNVGTLHSLAYRSLGKVELTVKHEKEFSKENPKYNLSASRDNRNVGDPYGEMEGKTNGDRWRQEMDILRARRIPIDSGKWQFCREFAKSWEQWKESNGLLDFTDLLEKCLEDVDECPGNPAALLVDEAQDLSRLGIDLLMKWGRQTQKIVFAGDDRQALYEWAGADAEAFIGISTEPSHRFVIDQSWRVPRKIHQRACNWVNLLSVKEDAEWKPRDADGWVGPFSGNGRGPETIINEAEKDALAGKTVMILASCSFMLTPTINALKRKGVPFCNPYRVTRGDWNPLVHGGVKKVMPVDRLLSFLKPCVRAWPDLDARFWTRHDLSLWLDMLEAKGRLNSGAKERLKAFRGQHDHADADDLRGLATPELCSRAMELCYQDKPEELHAAMEFLRESVLAGWGKKLDYAMRVAEKSGPEKLREVPKITIGTIHSVKGGESQVVYLMPDLSPKGYAEWAGGPKRRDAIIRMFYVGMTRASEKLVLCAASSPRSVRL
jgi:DNA helicase-2/ATP-dependent DNA helicase PcrA